MPRKSLTILCFFLLFIYSLAQAENWDILPVPNQTTLLKEDEMLMNNQKIKTMRYRSRLSVQEIRNFYSRFLQGLGWEEDCPECRQQPGIHSQLSFIRGDNKVAIFIIPNPPFSKKGESELVVAMSKIKSKIEVEQEARDAGFKDFQGSDLDFVPRYPQTQRVFSIESDSSRKITLIYHTNDGLDEILSFYRQNMPAHNWELVNRIDFQDLPPGLEKIQSEANLKGGGALMFNGPLGECVITVSEHPEENDLNIIGINYDAK
jgi:hypothetical protein